VYESFPGWQFSTASIEHFEELPARAARYIQFLETLMDTPIKIVSTGPERDQLITR
nr:adenylosuccinate synthetase [FCB group bacterium]